LVVPGFKRLMWTDPPVPMIVAPVTVSVVTVNFVVLGMKSSKLTAADDRCVEDGQRQKGKRPVGRPRKLKRSDTAGDAKRSVKREKKSPETAGKTKRSKKASSLAVAETVFGDKLSKDGARRKKNRKKTTESSSPTTLRSVIGDGDRTGKVRKTRRKKTRSTTQQQN